MAWPPYWLFNVVLFGSNLLQLPLRSISLDYKKEKVREVPNQTCQSITHHCPDGPKPLGRRESQHLLNDQHRWGRGKAELPHHGHVWHISKSRLLVINWSPDTEALNWCPDIVFWSELAKVIILLSWLSHERRRWRLPIWGRKRGKTWLLNFFSATHNPGEIGCRGFTGTCDSGFWKPLVSQDIKRRERCKT